MATIAANSRFRLKAEAFRAVVAAQGRKKEWVARQAGVHPSYISHALAGRSTFDEDVSNRVALALGVPFFVIFDASDDPNNASMTSGESAA